MYCSNCASEIPDRAIICVKCGVPVIPVIGSGGSGVVQMSGKNRVTFVLLGLFLGGLGIHNFYAGYVGRGITQLLITVCTFWLIFPIFVVGLWALIEICTVTTDSRGNRLS
jgi:TM2 domain-containing membrane protein YozV